MFNICNYLVVFPLFLIGCASKPIYIKGNTLYYSAPISEELVEQAISLATSSKEKIQKLEINSTGGDNAAGIKFGYWVHNNNIRLIVDETCFSACANYIFTASSVVYLKRRSIIGWHGGALQEDWTFPPNYTTEKLESWDVSLKKWREEETEFFQIVGVDQKITIYGQLNDFELMKKSGCVNANIFGWTYSFETIKKLGVKNIVFEDKKPRLTNRHGTKVLCQIDIPIDA